MFFFEVFEVQNPLNQMPVAIPMDDTVFNLRIFTGEAGEKFSKFHGLNPTVDVSKAAIVTSQLFIYNKTINLPIRNELNLNKLNLNNHVTLYSYPFSVGKHLGTFHIPIEISPLNMSIKCLIPLKF